jgi:hypothetical protein
MLPLIQGVLRSFHAVSYHPPSAPLAPLIAMIHTDFLPGIPLRFLDTLLCAPDTADVRTIL